MDIELNINIEDEHGDISIKSGLNSNHSPDVVKYIESFFERYDALSNVEITIKAK